MTESESKALSSFLANNPDLERLSAHLATFNIFHALKIEKRELQHSNTLAWLLDPGESHRLGDVFLRRILSNILLESDAEITGISPAQVELMEFSEVEVRREWRNIDVLVVVNSKPKLVLLIENKIGCGEGPGQLAGYRELIEREFPSFVLMPVFLTIDGHASEDVEAAKFIPYSHGQLLDLLNRIIDSRRSQLTEAVAVFLEHYLNTLRRLTMRDGNLTELCKNIYRKHRDAIDLIVEYGMESEFRRIAAQLFKNNGSFETLYMGPNEIRFIPKSWIQLIPSNGNAWKGLTRPVSVLCTIYKGSETKLRFIAEVSSMDDPKLRMECVKCLQKHGFKLTKAAFDEGATFSRFLSISEAVDDMGDTQQLQDAIETLLRKAADLFPKAEIALREVFKRK